MNKQEEILETPHFSAKIWPSGSGHWDWSASYTDGSGMRQSWSPTRRGAKTSAINQGRRLSGYYKPMKFKWKPNNKS